MSTLAAGLGSLDRRLHAWLQRRGPGAPAPLLLRASSTLGDGWMWLLGGLALAWSAHPLAALGLAVAAAAAVNAAVVVVKTCVRRPRPGAYRENAFLQAAIGGPPSCDRFSFPSGHAANAVALAMVLARTFPAAAAALFAVSVLVGASRVALGHHYLSDMVAGALLGLLAGAAAVTVAAFAA